MDYSSEQMAIMNHKKGHALVHAVPGSGKTHSLVGRVEYLLDSDVIPEHILVIMYGKDPCRDFIRRLQETTSGENILPRIKTFHSIAGKYLHTLTTAGLIPEGRIPAKEKEPFIMQQLYQKAFKGLTKKNQERLDERTFKGLVTKTKANVTLINDGLESLSTLEKKVFLRFEKHRKEAGIRFFDDLLYDLWSFMRDNPNYQQYFRSRLRYLIIDEYQDINPTQQQLVRSLVGGTRDIEVMAVGDVNQTIYEFRGSKPEIMLTEFEQEFKTVTHYCLSKTFRYGQALSDAANRLISHNTNRVDLVCTSDSNVGETEISVVSLDQLSIKEILKKCREKGKPSLTCAILTREYHHAYELEVKLMRAKIDYAIEAGKGILFSSQVRSIMGYLKLANNGEYFLAMPKNERLSYVQTMLFCPKLYLSAQQRMILVNSLAANPTNISAFLDCATDIDNEKVKKQVIDRRTSWDFALGLWPEDNAEIALRDLKQRLRYMRNFSNDNATELEIKRKMAAIDALIMLARLGKYSVHELLLYYDERLQPKDSINVKVSINTIHSAKGLEWDMVIIPNLVEGGFPSADSVENDEIEAERRLFYVGMTRARKRLYLLANKDSDTSSIFISESMDENEANRKPERLTS